MNEKLEEKEVSKVFNILNHINVNKHTERKKNLTYLSWAWAWAEVKKIYPEATYKIERFGEGKTPYLYDEGLGYMVFTQVTIEELTHEMWLPVMDHNNLAMKDEPYEKKFRNSTAKVDAATMFDINSTIMRCLTKNLAMHGLGLYIYAGEDLPEAPPVPTVSAKQEKELQKLIEELAQYLEDENAEGKTTYWLVGRYSQGGEGLADIERTKFADAKKAINKMIKNNKPKEETTKKKVVEDVAAPKQESLLEGKTTKAKS